MRQIAIIVILALLSPSLALAQHTNPNAKYRANVNVVTDCGAVADGVTDDATVVQACFNAFQGHKFIFPQTKQSGACSYKFSATLFPKGEGTVIAGESGGFKNDYLTQGGTVACWAAGVTGIEIDLTGSNCSGCQIENISLQGSEGTHHLVTPTELNIPSGANLPLYKRTILTIQRDGANTLTVNTSRVVGLEGLTQQVGSTVLISGVVSDTTMNGRCVIATLVAGGGTATNPTQFTCTQNGAASGPFVEGTVGLPTTGSSSADGIRLCSNFVTIRQVVIHNFGRHGINADSSAAQAMCPSNFSDDLVLRDSFLVGNQGDGYLCNGVDCNAHLLSGNAVYYNVLWGLEDQSSLGNTHIGNQLSNGGHSWASSTTPATKTISTISRSLTLGVSTATVVLSQADANMKLGSCMVIAGVTDSSFNTTAGQCFFITSYTDSTHYQYEQPGAPANASSSGGTSRMAKFSEAYLSSGVDDGAQKIGTQAASSQPTIVNQYVEGGQNCKWGATTLLFGGASTPVCASIQEWQGNVITTQGCTGLGGSLCFAGPANKVFARNDDFAAGVVVLRSGATANQHTRLEWWKYDNQRAWVIDGDTNGTLGSTGSWVLTRGGSVRRLYIDSSLTRIDSEGSAAVEINKNGGQGSGTAGLEVWSGGASPTLYGKLNSSGLTVGASGSAIADTRQLVQSVFNCGTTTTCANTANGSLRIITGNVALSSASPSQATIASISPAFTSAATYNCTATPEGATAAIAAGGIAISKVSGSSFTLTGPNTVTTVVDYTCIGN